jgi:ectoine hydroxylase-related dioxygenase (phytanoyl-CoA dioxygenase family)
MMLAVHTPGLTDAYPLERDAIDEFRRDGFIHLRGALTPETLERYADEITTKVVEMNTMHLPLAERSTYHQAFLQVANIWRESEIAKELVFSRRLARIATELLGSDGVRLYHDQALYKEPGGGITPWHVDQHYWPLASPATVTAWIPLQDTPVSMGPVAFAAGSHRFSFLRDLSISDDSERSIQEAMDRERFPYVERPFALGDVSFHYGYTFHRAPPNQSKQPRKVMTIIYMDRDITVSEPANAEQRGDLETWLPGARIGATPVGPLNPLLYETGDT